MKKWAFFLITLGVVYIAWLNWPQYPTKMKQADRFAIGAMRWVNVEYSKGNMDKAEMESMLLDFMMRNL